MSMPKGVVIRPKPLSPSTRAVEGVDFTIEFFGRGLHLPEL